MFAFPEAEAIPLFAILAPEAIQDIDGVGKAYIIRWSALYRPV